MTDLSRATRPSHDGRGTPEAEGCGGMGGIGWQEIGIIVAIVIAVVIIVRLRA